MKFSTIKSNFVNSISVYFLRLNCVIGDECPVCWREVSGHNHLSPGRSAAGTPRHEDLWKVLPRRLMTFSFVHRHEGPDRDVCELLI